MSLIYNRKTKSLEQQKEYKEHMITFLYKSCIGRILLKSIVINPAFSNLESLYYKSKLSKKDIIPFIEKYDIDMENFNVNDFSSFNDFFTRKKEYHTTASSNELIAIADSKLIAYPIEKHSTFLIKDVRYRLQDILESEKLAQKYIGGYALVFRLSPDDYHRYVFLDNGKVIKKKKIKGVLHTIRPISNKYKVYQKNTREITLLNTQHFGKVVEVDVGALLIGRMINHEKSSFKRLEEKGYFEYGGSTIMLLFEPNKINLDKDILTKSLSHLETKVQIGERIGEKCND